ncbi:MAG: hypothetical protein ACPIOQ_81945, partial [Promethearchaeia archaeon]
RQRLQSEPSAARAQGEVRFSVRSVSKGSGVIGSLLFPLLRPMQTRFFRDQVVPVRGRACVPCLQPCVRLAACACQSVCRLIDRGRDQVECVRAREAIRATAGNVG